MNIKEIDKVFKELYQITLLENIAFHKIIDGELEPVHMLETEKLSSKQWKEAHSKLHVKVIGDPVLERAVKGEIVYINDIANDINSSPAFKSFGIKSIAVFPLFRDSKVFGIIVIPALKEKFNFRDDIIDRCKKLIANFNKDII